MGNTPVQLKGAYNSYAGADIVASITIPGKGNYVFGELQTITYSIHRDKYPVRACGFINPKGYCLSESARVLTKDRGYISIKNIKENEYVQSGPNSYNKVLALHKQSPKECYRITLEDGYELDGSYDHPVMTSNGWKEIGQLTVNDMVVVTGNSPSPQHDYAISDDILVMTSYLIGDGFMYRRREGNGLYEYRIELNIDDSQMDIIGNKTEEILNRLGIAFEDYRDKNANCTRRCISVYKAEDLKLGEYNDLHRHLLAFGLYNVCSHTRFVPNELIARLSKRQITLFLSVLFPTNGCYVVSANGEYVDAQYCTTSKRLVQDVRLLLNKLGIVSLVSESNNVNIKVYEVIALECLNDGYVYRKFKTREYLGEQTVYDLTIDKAASFISNCILVHNTRGPRTIAGSLIFTVFDKHMIYNILQGTNNNSVYSDKNGNLIHAGKMITDELPPFDVTITFANEYGSVSKLSIYGITITDEGQVMSIEDMLTENTMTYIATDIDLMTNADQSNTNESQGRSIGGIRGYRHETHWI